MQVPGYLIQEEFGRDELFVFARAERISDGSRVLLKAARTRLPSAIARLRREHALLAALAVEGVPSPRGFEPEGVLVLPDDGGRPLRTSLEAGRIPLAQALQLGVQLAEILGQIHRQGIVHRALDPEGIFVDPALQRLRVLNFAAASRLAEEEPGLVPFHLGEGVAYLAPEQTGRMNRPVDERADLYAIGALLYLLLTGRPPFKSADALELLHWQVARIPPSPSELEADVPAPVSAVVMKLLAKNAEDRYQTATGLAADLRACLESHTRTGVVPPFVPGRSDVSSRFTIPHRLYGREAERRTILEAFERASGGETVLSLVVGYSGVGKTSLVSEVHPLVARDRGRFASGKFDQLERNTPYSALLQALRSLVRQVLAESEERVEAIRSGLGEALGSALGVISAVLPEVEMLVGPQPTPPPLPSTEAHNRFNMAFTGLVRVLAQRGHPLVLFLDDLQWADSGTLSLLSLWLTDPTVSHLLLIGAFRDNEVSPEQPLSRTLQSLQSAGATVNRLTVSPLRPEHLRELLADALHRPDGEVDHLAELLHQKTDGNPFFVTQFLRALAADGLIAFDHDRRCWRFDIERIAATQPGEYAVELMTRRLGALGAGCRKTLMLAACVGSGFSLDALCVVRRCSPGEVAGQLWEAVQAGLVVPTTSGFEQIVGAPDDVLRQGAPSFRFMHDRVQQAAYALIPEEERRRVHLEVGLLLLEQVGEDVPAERLFEIVNHLDLGRELVEDPALRRRLAALDFEAGRRAKASAAFQAALRYFDCGRSLFPGEDRGELDRLAFELLLEAAECQWLCGRFEEAQASLTRLLERAPTRLDRARVYTVALLQNESLSRYAEAVRIGREALGMFGLSFPETPEDRERALAAELTRIDALLGTRSIASLVDLPLNRDPETRMVMRLLTNLHTSCFLSGDRMLTRLNTAAMVRLSLEHGNCEESSYGYILHAAMVLIPARADFAGAYQFGSLAMQLAERLGPPAIRAKVLMNFSWAVSPFRANLRASVPLSHEAYRLGTESGLFVEASYALFNDCWFELLSGTSLAALERLASSNVEAVRRVRMTHFCAALQIILQWGRALQGRTASPTSLSDDSFDEAAFGRNYVSESLFQMFYLDAKLALLQTFGDWRGACEVARRAEAVIRDFTGTIWDVLRVYHHALSLAALHRVGEPPERLEAEQLLPGLLSRMQRWAEGSPENFRAPALLVGAEVARVQGRTSDALAGYQAALAAAEEQPCPRERALASELFGEFLRERGQTTEAATRLAAARDAYAEWGATAKVEALENRYPLLSRRAAPPHVAPVDFLTAVKTAHAIAGELELSRLLPLLVRLAVENAGAERGIFLQERAGGAVVVAEGVMGSEGAVLEPAAPLAGRSDLSRAMVNLALRSGRSVLVDDASRDPQWAGDPYVQERRPRSVLCLPVVHQRRRQGLLYLENNLAPAVFTPERLEMLRILSAEAAIALENAELYEGMRKEVDRRAAAERGLREALSEVEGLKNRLQAENIYLQEEIHTQHNFEEIVGNHPALLEALRKVEKVAPTDSTVLIFGETGTGKELFARAVHNRSARRDRPLVKVNCGAIAPGLVESELFGHVKGAFTGALQARPGRFELANGGALFLDEVSELPLDIQVKLLRVLQEREFEPVGGTRTLRVDVRVIAASNRRLDEAVRAGRFRADLLYRLNVFPLQIPPLRERRSDIPLLAAFFLGGLAKRLGKPLERVERGTMERLMRYDWPGNVRELQNVIERAAILANRPVVSIEPDALAGETLPAVEAEDASLEGMERTHILQMLARTAWVVEGPKGAALLLGLHPNTLRSRMKKLGIVRPAHDIS
jgi:predicted ATPase/transcriptional regulator with GAF, ATPase, and Fis domain